MKEIPLTQGKVALVDDADFEKVREHTWCVCKTRRGLYAKTSIRKPNGKRATLLMHRFLLPDSEQADHKSGDGLDNRRENLRAATHAENQHAFRRKRANATSSFRGVSWDSREQKWLAQIKTDGKGHYIGLFKIEQDAARAYDAAARKFFGEFASPNFPD